MLKLYLNDHVCWRHIQLKRRRFIKPGYRYLRHHLHCIVVYACLCRAEDGDAPGEDRCAAARDVEARHRRPSLSQGRAPGRRVQIAICSAIAPAGIAPEMRFTSRPPRKRIIVGMLRMAKREATSGSASVSTFATTTAPARWPASFASSGATARHGPHHAAQKSTSTGAFAFCTSSSKSCAERTGMGRDGGSRAALHAAHFARSPSRAAGRRLELEHAWQSTIIGALAGQRANGAAPTQARAQRRDADCPGTPRGSSGTGEARSATPRRCSRGEEERALLRGGHATPLSPPLAPLVLLVVLACTPALAPDPQSSGGSGSGPAPDAALFGDDADFSAGDDAGEPAWESGPPAALDDAGALAPPPSDAAPPPVETGPGGACGHPPGAGDLVIDELMIESVAGAGDDGEWLEVTNTAGCALDLRGLHGDCPVGSKVHTFDVTDDLWVPPGGTFLVADSLDPAINHDLPGVVLAWAGHAGDVLRNQGGTVTLRSGDVLVDSLTWPSMKLAIGASVELPADCPANDAASFDAWQPAIASWFPGFRGTPGATNVDVSCP